MMKKMQGEKSKRIKNILENLFVVVLAFYPLRHIDWGLDLWDTGYNYANFAYMGTEHMDSMWLFSTYLSNVVGNFMMKLPSTGSLVGMNFYTGLLVSGLALSGYWFCTRKLRIQSWIVFVGEMVAISLCWCPTALLYNYITYVLFLGCVVLLYVGLTEEKKVCLIIAGVCLGTNVLVRFSNLPEMAMILAVWVYDFICVREERKSGAKVSRTEGFWKRTLRHTGYCLCGYLGALVVLFTYIQLRYGMDEYIAGIMRLFGMTDNAPDYKATAMVTRMLGAYIENLYWVIRIGGILGAGMVMATVLGFFRELFGKKSNVTKFFDITTYVMEVCLSVAMVLWLYIGKNGHRFCSTAFYSYDSIFRPGILFMMLTMFVGVIRIFHPKSNKEEKLISGMLILVILLTSLGSNNGVYPSMNNQFVAAPYVLWQCWRFICNVGGKKISYVIVSPVPVKCILGAFLCLCLFQFGAFGVRFVFAEGTGIQDISAGVENNEILKNVKMSEERARWMTELSSYVNENGLKGQEVILYGDIPALSYYLEMPSAFNPWSDLDSYSYETMCKDMEELNEKTPVIIMESSCAASMEGQVSDRKLLLIQGFMEKNDYAIAFRNEKFVVYR